MRIIPFAVAASMIAQPAAACVQSVTSDNLKAVVCTALDACRTVLYSQLRNGSVNQRSAELQLSMQALLDTRTPILLFPAEDPAKAEDPGLQAVYAGRFFWSDVDGNPTNGNALTTTHITARHCEVVAVEWDGVKFNLIIAVAGP